MLTVLLQLYQTRVAGLILPVFSLQYHDQTDFVLSGEQPVLAPEGGVPVDWPHESPDSWYHLS